MLNSKIEWFFTLIIIIQQGRGRDLWSEELPEVAIVLLEKGKPIHLQEDYEKVQIRGLSGTLYSDSLSQLLGVEELRIFQNQLRGIEKGALCSSPKLKILELEFFGNKKPPALNKDIFDNCNNLEELLLKFDDEVDTPAIIDQDTFENLQNLKKLILHGYKIDHLTKDFLKLNNKSLSSLVTSSSHTQQIDSDAFDDLRNLEEVVIIHNIELTHLPTKVFKNLSKLKVLLLRDNNLRNLSWDEFQGLVALEKLILVDNQISSFDSEKIARNMPNLKDLQIELNPGPCKQKAVFVDELKAKLKHSIEVSYKFAPEFYDSCEQE